MDPSDTFPLAYRLLPLAAADPEEKVLSLWLLLTLLLLIVLYLLVTFVIVRWGRRVRSRLARRRSEPTADSDVWAMHRLPDEPEE